VCTELAPEELALAQSLASAPAPVTARVGEGSLEGSVGCGAGDPGAATPHGSGAQAGPGDLGQGVRFAGGRLAVRRAAGSLGLELPGPVLRGVRGRPGLLAPPGGGGGDTAALPAMLSISHKDSIAVGLVRRTSAGAVDSASGNCGGVSGGKSTRSEAGPCMVGRVVGLGVDVEDMSAPPRSPAGALARRILTAAEHSRLNDRCGDREKSGAALQAADGPRAASGARGAGDGLSGWQEALLLFSIKEAAYKAMDPLLGRRVGWHEVEVAAFHPSGGPVKLSFIGALPLGTAAEAAAAAAATQPGSSTPQAGHEREGAVEGPCDDPCNSPGSVPPRPGPRLELVGEWARVGNLVVSAVEARLASRRVLEDTPAHVCA